MLFCLGLLLSMMAYKEVCRPHCPSTVNQIRVGSTIIHLHHWILSAFGLFYFTNPFIRGLLTGGVVHGILTYDDWHIILKSV